MENIINYIIEKLKINSNTKFTEFNPDKMNESELWICSCDKRNNNFHDSVYEYSNVNDKDIFGFLLGKGNTVSTCIKKGNAMPLTYHSDIDMLLDEIIDDGYDNKRICMLYGRFFIETKKSNYSYCKNYFIYALSKEGYEKIESYFDNLDWRNSGSGQDLEFLKDENIYIEIKKKE